MNQEMELKNQSDGTNNRFGRRKNGRCRGIDHYR